MERGRQIVAVFALTLTPLAAACGRAAPASKADPPAPRELSRSIVDPYLKIDSALASDTVDGVTARAREIAAAAERLGSAGDVAAAAGQLTSAADLADARVKFGALSEAIDAYMAREHLAAPAGIRVAFCPMVLKPWLQEDGPIRNPYYGRQMLTCGSFRN